MFKQLFTKKKYHWYQRLTGVHRIHHPRWSFGWSFPLTTWCYFEARTLEGCGVMPTRHMPARWERCERDSYHDSTATGRY